MFSDFGVSQEPFQIRMAMNMTVRTTSNLRYGRLGLAAVLLLAAAGCSRGNVQAAAPAMPAPLVTAVKATAQEIGRAHV
jgi:hypothetical protein